MRSPSFQFRCFSVLAAAAALCACGGGHDEMTKRLTAMQSDLTKLQAHSDRLEQRLEALEMRKEAPVARAAEPASNGDGRGLLVVKLEPGDDTREAPASDAPTAALRPEDSAADNTPRPVIRVYGSRTDVDTGSDGPKRKR